jgi:Holliday junction DNA helicase RuvB
VRDFAQIIAAQVVAAQIKAKDAGLLVTREIVEESLKRLEIDALGLERYDREILKIIIERYGGGPVGAETLAISIGESVDTLEDYYEPYLIQAGLIQRTPRGRVVTSLAYNYLRLPKETEDDGPLFQ